jgi:hypothetical protein
MGKKMKRRSHGSKRESEGNKSREGDGAWSQSVIWQWWLAAKDRENEYWDVHFGHFLDVVVLVSCSIMPLNVL